MEFKVKESEEIKPLSKQEQEREVVRLHEEKEKVDVTTQTTEAPVNAELEIDEEKILNFIESKHGRKFSKFEELFQQQSEPEKLPEDVEAFYKFKKETGRSLNEFVMINRDLDKSDPDSLLREYYSQNNPTLDAEDIDFMVNEFKENDIDDESSVKKKSIQKKQELDKAKSYFKQQADKFKAPLESREPVMNEDQRREFEAFQDYVAKSKTEKESLQRKSEWFQKKSDEVFGEEFKGFEFKLADDKSTVFAPGDKNTLKQNQMSINNFVKKFINDQGLVEDAKGYHKALSVAMNPDQFAKHFYELGQSEALESQSKKDKNINFNMRNTPSTFTKNGLKIRESTPESSGKLRIKST